MENAQRGQLAAFAMPWCSGSTPSGRDERLGEVALDESCGTGDGLGTGVGTEGGVTNSTSCHTGGAEGDGTDTSCQPCIEVSGL